MTPFDIPREYIAVIAIIVIPVLWFGVWCSYMIWDTSVDTLLARGKRKLKSNRATPPVDYFQSIVERLEKQDKTNTLCFAQALLCKGECVRRNSSFAAVIVDKEKANEAYDLFSQAASIAREQGGVDHPLTQEAELKGAYLLCRLKRTDEARELLESLLERVSDDELERVQVELAEVYLAKNLHKRVIELLEPLVAKRKKPFFDLGMGWVPKEITLFNAYSQSGDWRKAEALVTDLLDEARELEEEWKADKLEGDNSNVTSLLFRRGYFFVRYNKFEQARADFEEALERLILKTDCFDAALVEQVINIANRYVEKPFADICFDPYRWLISKQEVARRSEAEPQRLYIRVIREYAKWLLRLGQDNLAEEQLRLAVSLEGMLGESQTEKNTLIRFLLEHNRVDEAQQLASSS